MINRRRALIGAGIGALAFAAPAMAQTAKAKLDKVAFDKLPRKSEAKRS